MEPAVSAPIQDQAVHRVRRLTQRGPQTTLILHQQGSFNDWQFANQERKVLPGLLARVRQDGELEVEGGAMTSSSIEG